MESLDEISIQLKKYFKKLSRLINEEPTFRLINVNLVNKVALDDILCCIEAKLPQEYIKAVKKSGKKHNFQGYSYYLELTAYLRRKFIFSSSYYAVMHGPANAILSKIVPVLMSDIKAVYEQNIISF